MIRIGIADDDPLVRRTLAQLLSTEEGISVAWTAQDGQEALDLIHSTETEPVQAVLLDVQMPRLDGLTLAKTLHEENPELAIIILSTLIADSISNEAFAAGVRGFVAKEDDVDALAGGTTVATLLPGVEFSTRSPYPDARRLLEAGVTVALATDCNPGSCFTSSMAFCLALAVREMRMTPAEALRSAQAAVRTRAGWGAPVCWAGWSLAGDVFRPLHPSSS